MMNEPEKSSPPTGFVSTGPVFLIMMRCYTPTGGFVRLIQSLECCVKHSIQRNIHKRQACIS